MLRAAMMAKAQSNANDSEVAKYDHQGQQDPISQPTAGRDVDQNTSAVTQSIAKPDVSQAAAPSTTLNELESATADGFSGLQQSATQDTSQVVGALSDIHGDTQRLNTTMSKVYKLLYDERYAPKKKVWERPDPVDNTSKEAEPGDGKGQGVLDGIVGAALSGLASLYLGKKVLDALRGKATAKSGTVKASTVAESKTTNKRDSAKPLPKTGTSSDSVDSKKSPSVDQEKAPRAAPKAPSTSPVGDSLDNEAKPKARGRAGLAVAAATTIGATAVAGFSYLSEKVRNIDEARNENRKITMQETLAQNERIARGQVPMEGEELIAFRTAITEASNMVADPRTGFSLSEAQTQAVRSNLLSPDQASRLSNDQVLEVMKGNSVTFEPVSQSAPESNVAETAAVVAAAGLTTAAGLVTYNNMKRVPDIAHAPAPAPTPVKSPTRILGPVSTTASPTATKASASALAPPLLARQSVPDAGTLKQVESSIKTAGGARPNFASRAIPAAGVALSAYDVYNVVTDDELTKRQKVEGVTDIAGGTAGAIVGSKAGASAGAAVGAAIGAFFFGAGAVPGAAIGAAIGGIGGGIAGYMGGSAVTKSAREWMFGDGSDPSAIQSAQLATSGAAAAAQVEHPYSAINTETEKAFSTIVSASKPVNNPWVSSIVSNTADTKAGPGIGVLAKTSAPSPVAGTAPDTRMRVTVSDAGTSVAGPASSAVNLATYTQAPQTAAVTGFSASTRNIEPVKREVYNNVTTTKLINPEPDRVRTTDTAKQQTSAVARGGQNNTAQTRIDDVPSIIQDGGLSLFNVGML